ncbi:MAG: glycosyltransferase, partial [Bacteroidetes bacterium]|nr:glycosyltransferase [Bacteroidota bacterium]
MRIGLISQEYPPETARGGIGTQTWLKAQGLTRRGHRVFVISRSPNNERYEQTDGLLTVIRIPGMDEQFQEMTDTVQWITHSVVVAAEIQRLHQRENLDLLDFPEWGAEAYTYLLNRTPWNLTP